MIPSFNQSGVLPPFVSTPTCMATTSPYKTTLVNLINRFSYTPERMTILIGFIKHRLALKKAGLVTGIQWIDGSFVEDIEKISPALLKILILLLFLIGL